jgi:hypothetical protein
VIGSSISSDAIGIIIAFAILGICIVIAWRRRKSMTRVSRPLRVTISAFVFAATCADLAGASAFHDQPLRKAVFLTLFGIVLFQVIGSALVLMIEFVFARFTPVRSPAWLVKGMTVLFLLLVGTWLLAARWLGRGDLFDWVAVGFAATAAAPALIWWSCLPPVEAPVARLFE